ncbi:MAG TPA: hypothetical protein PLB96_06775 [Syntrophales bacterium]|nr:hypothetical protein [Syntrophales bacterium]
MWVFTKRGFVSIIASENSPTSFMVQSHFPGHIESLFPNARVTEAPAGYGNYRFRAAVQKQAVAEKLLDIVEHIDYFTFKESIPDERYRKAVMDAWATLNKHALASGKAREPEEFMP